jgi:hypothetical protein
MRGTSRHGRRQRRAPLVDPGGYEIAIVDESQVNHEASYAVNVTNGRLTERVEFRFSPQAMRTSARRGRSAHRCLFPQAVRLLARLTVDRGGPLSEANVTDAR